MQPNEISTGLSAFGSGLADIFTNAGNVVQSVSSVYDQLTGKSQSVPGQSVQYSQSPAPPVVASAPAKSPETMRLNSTTLAIGAVVLIGALLLIKD